MPFMNRRECRRRCPFCTSCAGSALIRPGWHDRRERSGYAVLYEDRALFDYRSQLYRDVSGIIIDIIKKIGRAECRRGAYPDVTVPFVSIPPKNTFWSIRIHLRDREPILKSSGRPNPQGGVLGGEIRVAAKKIYENRLCSITLRRTPIKGTDIRKAANNSILQI